MAGGNNHAKQIVIEQAESLSADLQNGHEGDLGKMGRLLALQTKMITPMYEADFVTMEDCAKNHKGNGDGITKIRVGPISIEGKLSTALIQSGCTIMCCVGVIFAIGKAESWW